MSAALLPALLPGRPRPAQACCLCLLQDLLKAVYPSATSDDTRRMADLVYKPPSRPLPRLPSIQQQVINIAKAFAACDTDGSGALDLSEFTEAMADLAGSFLEDLWVLAQPNEMQAACMQA